MANILNLTLKKDVFDALKEQTTNDIFIDKTPYWEKRLMDKKTGVYKNYDIVRVSCGSPEKIDYPIDVIALNIEDQFMITIKRGNCESEEIIEDVVEEIIEDVTIEEPTYDVPEIVEKEVSAKTRVKNLLDDMCERLDVFVVNSPVAVIRPNGMIMGTNRKLFVDADVDVRVELKSDEIVHYKDMSDDDFVKYVKLNIDKYIKGNYVFIWKKMCGFKKIASGEDVFVFRIATRKKFKIRR